MSRRISIFGASFTSVIPLLLDLYPNAAAAYSLRKLRNAYNGAAIRVRRSSDNAEEDIGFIGNDLDTVSLLAFTGAGDGRVTTWYDQSGSGLHATNTNATQQPFIVASGNVYTENSKPVVRNPQRNTLRNLNVPLSTLQPLPVSVVFAGRIVQHPVNFFAGTEFHLAGSSNVGGGSRYEMSSSITPSNFRTVRRSSSGPGSAVITETPVNNNPFIQQGFFRLTQIDGRQAQVDATPASYQGTPFDTASNFQLLGGGAIGSNNRFFANISAFEYIIYQSDQHANRVGIEDNINNYYNIYP